MQIKKIIEQTGLPLANVEFLVTKVNGEIMGRYRTNYNGLSYVDLEPGWYVVTETYVPNGYSIDPVPKNIQIKAGTPTTIEFRNKQLSTLRIKKIDAETKKGIYGVKFLVRDNKNNIIGEYVTDQSGIIDLPVEIQNGRYKIEEIQAAQGYILDNIVKTIDIKQGETTEIVWENQPQKGQIVVTKRAMDYNNYTGHEAGSLLQGAIFEIYDRSGVLVDRITSNTMGIASSKPLKLGTYSVKEVSSPRFFLVDSKITNAELNFHGQIVKFDISNYSVQLGTSVKKNRKCRSYSRFDNKV